MRTRAWVAVALSAAVAGGGAAVADHASGAAGGGVISVAESAQTPPNFIFPFVAPQFNTVYNEMQFQWLMYRPLYWLGSDHRAAINQKLSLANLPRYTHGDVKATVTLKPYRWSDGERVNARDVLFFMNIDKVEKDSYGPYSPGTLPDNVKDVTARGNTVTFTLTQPVAPGWFTGDELVEITPFPLAWDVTRTGAPAGSAACANASWSSVVVRSTKRGAVPVSAAAKSCAAVYDFLSRQAGFDPSNPKASKGATAAYATNPLWQVVDGPWHLTSYGSDGFVAMKPNPSYSGPVKPSVSEFDEVPFTSTAAEFNALAGGSVSLGYLPGADVTSTAKSPVEPGANNPRLADEYKTAEDPSFALAFFSYNFNSTGDGGQAGRIFRQLYFRQAMQLLVDQPLYIRKLFKGYAVSGNGPVPVLPANPYVSGHERSNPYPYDPARAVRILAAHGWKVVPGGTSICVAAAKCAVPGGTKLRFSFLYPSGDQVVDEAMAAEAASWKQAGIDVRLQALGGNTVAAEIDACSRCSWELGGFGGWLFSVYPSGEALFETGAPSNAGSYSNAETDRLIKASITTQVGLTRYENYVAKQLPVIWEPWPETVLELKKNLVNVDMNPFDAFDPEAWRLE